MGLPRRTRLVAGDRQAAWSARADRRCIHHPLSLRSWNGQGLENPAVQAWADANLKRFAYEWHRYFRGELLVKNDTDVTDADILRCNLILFGDPGSNSLIARVLPKMPVHWTTDE